MAKKLQIQDSDVLQLLKALDKKEIKQYGGNRKLTYFYKRCALENGTRCVSGNVCACLFLGVNGRFTFC